MTERRGVLQNLIAFAALLAAGALPYGVKCEA